MAYFFLWPKKNDLKKDCFFCVTFIKETIWKLLVVFTFHCVFGNFAAILGKSRITVRVGPIPSDYSWKTAILLILAKFFDLYIP